MWQLWGTLSVSALGGSFLLHYLKNFLFREKRTFRWDWDGIIERTLVTYVLVADQELYLIPIIIVLKALFRLIPIGFFESLTKVTEPGTVSQKVRLKMELALDLFLSPTFAILIGIIF